MVHETREVVREERRIRMACSCGAEWSVFLTPAGMRKRGYLYTRQCPEAQQQRRRQRQPA